MTTIARRSARVPPRPRITVMDGVRLGVGLSITLILSLLVLNLLAFMLFGTLVFLSTPG